MPEGIIFPLIIAFVASLFAGIGFVVGFGLAHFGNIYGAMMNPAQIGVLFGLLLSFIASFTAMMDH